MPADANIFQQYLRAPKSVSEYQADYDQAQVRKNALQLAAMDLSEKTQANQRTQQVRNALMGLGGAATDEQRINALKATATPEGFSQADALEKALQERLKTGASVDKDKATTKHTGVQTDEATYKLRIQKSDQAIKDISGFQTPQEALSSLEQHAAAGDIPPEQAQIIRQQLTTLNPADFPRWQLGMVKNIMSAKDRMEYIAPNANTVANNTQSAANNASTNATHVQTTGMTNATSRANNTATIGAENERARLTRETGKTEVVQTDAGPMVVNKTTGGGVPIKGPDGQAVGKPLKDIPPTVNTAIITNTQSLNQLDRALTLLGGNDIGDPAKGGQKGDANATGAKGYLPQAVLNRVDPQGVDARAEVSDVGSLKIHDRSGAAVTVSESPRLMPFIPLATDDAATVKKKLRRLRTEIANEARLFAETYSKDQGYKPSPVKPTAPAAPASSGMPDANAIDAELRRRAGGT